MYVVVTFVCNEAQFGKTFETKAEAEKLGC